MSVAQQLALARVAFARASKGVARAETRLTLREFAEDPDFCGLAVSPVAGAILDAADAAPVRISDKDCERIFGCVAAGLPLVPSAVVCVSAGRRGGKTSQLAAPCALHAAWFTPLRKRGAPVDPAHPDAQELAAGERPKVVIISATTDLARQAFDLTIGLIRQSPILSAAMLDDPTTKSAIIRRPDGIEVEIKIVAAKAQGASARSGTLLCLVMDEACFFRSEDGYAVTDTETFEGAVPALAPGARIYIVSTPWIEEYGLLEALIKSDWGTHRAALVAARIPSYVLNPKYDPKGTRERTIRGGPDGEETWRREIMAIPLPKGSRSFFDATLLRAAELRLPPAGEQPEAEEAGADLGHTNDASALACAQRYRGGVFSVAEVCEIATTSEQRPSATYAAFAAILVRRRVRSLAADGHYKETLREALGKVGKAFVEAGPKEDMFAGAKSVIAEARLVLGALSAPQRASLVEQLLSVIARPRPQGGFTIIEPRRAHEAGGTSHADAARAVVVALWRVGSREPALWVKKPIVARPKPARARAPEAVDWGNSGDRDDWR